MPIYEFLDLETQCVVEHVFFMADAPSIGTSVLIEGRKMVRLASFPRLQTADTGKVSDKYPYASDALARWTRPTGMTDLKFTATGKPIIKDKKQEANYAAAMGMERGGVEAWGENLPEKRPRRSPPHDAVTHAISPSAVPPVPPTAAPAG